MKKEIFLNTYINNFTMKDALTEIDKLIQTKKKSYVVAINVDVVVKMEDDLYLKKITDEADLVLVDGKPLIWISQYFKNPIKEKVSGSDLVPELCKIANEKNYSIFILGGKEGVAEKAGLNLLDQYKNIRIVGTYSPPIGFEKNVEELNRINDLITSKKPDILLACLGCPKQEKWIYENYKKYDATVSICAGATVDFLAGNVQRAPRWMSNIGLEWLFRFFQEPRRMFKRYFVNDMKIFKLVFKYRRK